MKRTRRNRGAAWGCALFLAFIKSSAFAAETETLPSRPAPFAYGLLIGANHGGPGQAELRYAEDDARKLAQVIRDMGRYGRTDMRVLTSPEPQDVTNALDVIGARLREHQQRGEQAVLVFYYSGHAKATSIQLGANELPLAGLRERLRALPSTLTLVVLDACQSGAFARTKGAEPAADFSYNSVARLTTQGIAVMASSTGQELSQESDELRASYFTTNLIAGLRGAGDRDGDGRVTLDEAYQYAYRSTLAATERTQVGGQHVTLETDLVGQGDVPLTYPASSKSMLELPSALGARVMMQHKRSGNIVAEIHKAKGKLVRIALGAGDYEATVRDGASVSRCNVTLADDQITPLAIENCTPVKDTGHRKGEGAEGDEELFSPGRRELNRYRLEVGAGLSQFAQDQYVNTLGEFQYRRRNDIRQLRYSGAVLRTLGDYVAVGAEITTLPSMEFDRKIGSSTDRLETSAWRSGLLARGVFPVKKTPNVWGEVYGQVGFGFARSLRELTTSDRATAQEKTHIDWALTGGLGAAAGGKYAGAFLQGGYDYAPVLRNDIGDKHNVGGAYFTMGLRLKTE